MVQFTLFMLFNNNLFQFLLLCSFLFGFGMSYVEYCQYETTIRIAQSLNGKINTIVPISRDAIFVLMEDKSYQFISIREEVCLAKGQLPNEFTPSSYIKQ